LHLMRLDTQATALRLHSRHVLKVLATKSCCFRLRRVSSDASFQPIEIANLSAIMASF
jgi:hypothetical protein